jgi:hypothetical protein
VLRPAADDVTPLPRTAAAAGTAQRGTAAAGTAAAGIARRGSSSPAARIPASPAAREGTPGGESRRHTHTLLCHCCFKYTGHAT